MSNTFRIEPKFQQFLERISMNGFDQSRDSASQWRGDKASPGTQRVSLSSMEIARHFEPHSVIIKPNSRVPLLSDRYCAALIAGSVIHRMKLAGEPLLNDGDVQMWTVKWAAVMGLENVDIPAGFIAKMGMRIRVAWRVLQALYRGE